MEEGQPYFVLPNTTQSSEEGPDNGSQPQSALMLTKEPQTPNTSRRRAQDGILNREEEYEYASPPREDRNWGGYFAMAGSNSALAPPPPPPRSATLPPRRTQQPTPLPGNRGSQQSMAEQSMMQLTATQQPISQLVSSNLLASAPAPATTQPSQSSRPSSGPPFADGPRAGQPLPAHLTQVRAAIRAISREYGTKPPARADLKSRNNGPLISQNFHGSSGVMRTDSGLRDWHGDLNVFPLKWWEFLVSQKPRG